MKKSAGFQAIGRRKSAVARVYLRPTVASNTVASNTVASNSSEAAGATAANTFFVNSLPADDYFGRETSRMVIRQPLVLTSQLEKFDIIVTVNGGGKSAQAGAVRLGIARALIIADPAQRKALKAEGYLSRDSREVERKKYGRHGARRRPQFSKR